MTASIMLPQAGKRIKLEVKTNLELLMDALLFGFGVGLVFILWGQIKDPMTGFPETFLIGLFLTSLAFFLRAGTDCYYLIDPVTGDLVYHSQFLGQLSETHIVPASRIWGLLSIGERHSEQDEEWYTYRIVLLDVAGEIYNIGDPHSDLEKINADGQRLHTLTGLQFRESPPECAWKNLKYIEKHQYSVAPPCPVTSARRTSVFPVSKGMIST